MITLLPGRVDLEMIHVPRGEFVMGSASPAFPESPPHPVSISRDFLLARYPVTQRQWQAVMGANPSAFRGSPDLPVDTVSWDQAVVFCRRVNEQAKAGLRLPSEAEWEYACRAGTGSDFFFGSWGPFLDDTEVLPETRRALFDFAWFDVNSGGGSHPVGMKQPNPWGFHDMIGSVWEWCADVWHDDYRGAPSDGSAWLAGESAQPRRCLRGGAWDMDAFRCRSSYRSYDHRNLATDRFGFRIAADV